jgi:predicted nucleic acid-binding protein
MSTATPPDRFVLDGSITLAWLFHDEADPYADAIVAKLPALEMLVPRLWHLEIANVLLVGERRGRCTQADIASWLSYPSGLPIVVDGATEARAWSDTLSLARQHGLSAYDAAYLELSMREGVALATLDAKRRAAMQALGVALYRP